jgi:hypothetical protein
MRNADNAEKADKHGSEKDQFRIYWPYLLIVVLIRANPVNPRHPRSTPDFLPICV